MSALNINIYGCSYCYKTSQCIDTRFTLYCYRGTLNIYGERQFWDDKSCWLPVFPYQDDYVEQTSVCGCDEFMRKRVIYYDGIGSDKCYKNIKPATRRPTSYPTPSESILCEEDEDCSITCDKNQKCSLIDGSLSSYLTLRCNNCNGVYIICPDGGCSIDCDADYLSHTTSDGCENAVIVYNGKLEDHGTININCAGEESCDDVEIRSDYIDSINIKCRNHAEEYQDAWIVCGFSLYARYTNYINVDLEGENALLNGYMYVDNAMNVEITAKGADAIRNTAINAQNASSFRINCASSDGSACDSNRYWLPSRASFNCYGNGCRNMGDIYTHHRNFSGIDLNLNACGECESHEGCLEMIKFQCGNGYESQFIYNQSYGCYAPNEYKYENALTNNGDCGCLDFMNKINFEDKNWDQQCYEPMLLSPIQINAIIIGSVTFTICILGFWYYYKAMKIREMATQKPPATDKIEMTAMID